MGINTGAGAVGGGRGGPESRGGSLGRSGAGGNKQGPKNLDIFGREITLAPNTPSPFNQKQGQPLTGKPTEGGGKPGEDNIAKSTANPVALNDVQKAVLESRRQANLQSDSLDAAQTILGAMPAPFMGAAFGLGRWMGKKAEDAALADPDRFKTDPNDPGAVTSKYGALTSNRARSAPSAKTTEASGSKDQELRKKKALPTLLGAPAQALGTFSNPVQIT